MEEGSTPLCVYFVGYIYIFVDEYFGMVLRNTLGIPIFVPWLQGTKINNTVNAL
jgi:hypothetical protein